MASVTEPIASKISSGPIEPDSSGHAREHTIVRLAMRWSKFHLDTAFG
jgi:hypothetical protein